MPHLFGYTPLTSLDFAQTKEMAHISTSHSTRWIEQAERGQDHMLNYMLIKACFDGFQSVLASAFSRYHPSIDIFKDSILDEAEVSRA